MQYADFMRSVEQRGGLSPEEAHAITRATLATLAEWITGREARGLTAQLPKELQSALTPLDEDAYDYDVEEFMRRVEARADVNKRMASRGIPAVFATLREAVTSDQFRRVMSQLPDEFRELAEPVTG